MTSRLTTRNHDRDSAGLRYVYPVISRRAGGLSIGINVNTNNACNWRCVYCQVPNLNIGAAPEIDFSLLADELETFLDHVLRGDFYDCFQVEADKRSIKDIAVSGNGEPTTAKDFLKLLTVIGDSALANGLLPGSKLVLITNGSLIHLPPVQAGLKHWHSLGGEVWFKLDRATPEGRQKINHSRQSDTQVLRNLRLSAALCTTKIQTCLLDYAEAGWSEAEQLAYLNFLRQVKNVPNLTEVLLYTLARPSYQPEAPRLIALTPKDMRQFAEKVAQMGFSVSVHE